MVTHNKLGKYIIENILGEGAMSVVYKATDSELDETVAIKLIRRELTNESLLKRVKREAQICRKLKHPNIVGTYDFSAGDPCYIVMEFVDGRQLKDYLDEGYRFNHEEIYTIIEQVLSALEHAHNAGITHRDIKPANIIVDDDKKTLVADFGIAKLDNSSMTLDGAIIGTPSYMSPEQCLGKGVDIRSDLFSVGSVLYQLLTGKKPFEGESYMDTMRKVLELSPPKPSKVNHKISATIDALVEKALSKKPENRFQSAIEFRHALKVALLAKPATVSKKKVAVLIVSVLLTSGVLYFGINHYHADTRLLKNVVDEVKEIDQLPVFVFDKDRFTRLFAGFACSQLEVDYKDQKRLTLTGHTRPEDMGLLKMKVKQLVGNVPYDFQVEQKARPYCAQETLIAAFEKNSGSHTGVKLEPYNHDNVYVEGEFLEYEIITPDYDAYLYVDYYQSDGTVVHLVPNANIEQPVSAYQQIVLGESEKGQKQWEVVPPFGQDMVSIIASSTPLFETERKEIEATDVYLADLKTGLVKHQANTLTANHIFVNTHPKAER